MDILVFTLSNICVMKSKYLKKIIKDLHPYIIFDLGERSSIILSEQPSPLPLCHTITLTQNHFQKC